MKSKSSKTRKAPTRQIKKARQDVTIRSDNRRQGLLDAAAKLFALQGFGGTSIRDIASEVGMLPGSIYYHFKSKEELMLAVHAEGVKHILDAVHEALDHAVDEPWARLEAACGAHLTALLEGGQYSMVVTPEFIRDVADPLRNEIVAQRDAYEQLFKRLIGDLHLPSDIRRSFFRLSLFGSLNWSHTWYRPGGESPKEIAHAMIALYRQQLDIGEA